MRTGVILGALVAAGGVLAGEFAAMDMMNMGMLMPRASATAAVGSGGNLQTFTGALGGVAADPVRCPPLFPFPFPSPFCFREIQIQYTSYLAMIERRKADGLKFLGASDYQKYGCIKAFCVFGQYLPGGDGRAAEEL